MNKCLDSNLLFTNIVWIIFKENALWIGMLVTDTLDFIKNLKICFLKQHSF